MTSRCIDEYASAAERRCAVALIDAILKRGHSISVHDGVETTLALSTNRNAIMRALCTTGEDFLRVRSLTGSRAVGAFMLVWQSCADPLELVADYTDNDECNAIYRDVQQRLEGVAA